MYSDRFTLPFISQVLIAAAERVRPGLGAWTPEARHALEEVFRKELSEVRARFNELFDDPGHWAKLESTLLEVCFPRYAAEAEKATVLEQRNWGLWRGGDLVARGVYAVAGLAVGLFLVKAPFIPIPETWDLLALAMGLAAPFLPDAQIWVAERKHERALAQIVAAMADAQAQQRLYEPLTAMRDTLRSDTDQLPAPTLPGPERTR